MLCGQGVKMNPPGGSGGYWNVGGSSVKKRIPGSTRDLGHAKNLISSSFYHLIDFLKILTK